MAQSDASRIISASARRPSSTPSSASQSTTRLSIAASCGMPSRHGTHFPQVCAPLVCSMVSCTANGHMPGGVASTRRAKVSRCAAIRASSRDRGAIDSLATGSPSIIGSKPTSVSNVFPVRHSNANDAPCGGRARKARRRHTGRERRRRVMRTERSAAVPQKGQA